MFDYRALCESQPSVSVDFLSVVQLYKMGHDVKRRFMVQTCKSTYYVRSFVLNSMCTFSYTLITVVNVDIYDTYHTKPTMPHLVLCQHAIPDFILC